MTHFSRRPAQAGFFISRSWRLPIALLPRVPDNWLFNDGSAADGAAGGSPQPTDFTPENPSQPDDKNIESVVVRGSKFDDPDITNAFAPVIAVTKLWPHEVAIKARTMPFGWPGRKGSLFDHVRTRGDWDVKNLKPVTDAVAKGELSSDLAERYGNFLYGVAMESSGQSLPWALTGAGGYQTLGQRHGGNPSLRTGVEGVLGTASGMVLSGIDAMSRVMPNTDNSGTFSRMTDNGFQWGDNPGDSKKIQNGWLYARRKHY